jgi:phospholipid transport system substrate-binding protein
MAAEGHRTAPLGLRVPILALFLALFFGLAGVSRATAEESAADADWVAPPRALIEKTVGQVLEILGTAGLDNDQRRTRIEAVAFLVFDFTTTSKLVLARNWKKLDKAQRTEFVGEFKQYLSRNYGGRLERYQKADVEVLNARVEPRRDVTVFTKVVGSRYDGFEMNYRLRFRKEEWKIIDIVIEGVSMLANLRAQFAEVMSREGAEGLLEAMRTRNAGSAPTR